MKKSTRKVTLDAHDKFTVFVRENIKSDIVDKLAHKFGVTLKMNNVGFLVIKGDKIGSAKLQELFKRMKSFKRPIEASDLQAVLDGKQVEADEVVDNNGFLENNHIIEFKSVRFSTIIKAKTKRQEELMDSIMKNKVTLAMGSAGTGKSFIALTVALKLLESEKIKKIIITKPPIDAGPEIGFLPGDENQKLAPYISSVMGILTELIGTEKADKLLKNGSIEIQNLGYLRGVTLGATKTGGVLFLLDEAQNVDFHQNKMILSRMGDHPESRIVYAGDQLQSDLKYKKDTLSLIYSIIKDSPYVGSVIFTRQDIVRSPTVKDLMERIETYEEIQNIKKLK